MCLKQKDWSKRGVPATSTRCPDHLSRQFLTAPKITQPNIFTFLHVSVCVSLFVCVCVCVCVSVCMCLSMWVSVFIRVRHVGKVCISSAEEFLVLCGKVEAVTRNCLLRWSEHLVEVDGTPLFFDQSFCFKRISSFCAPKRAFFRWLRNATPKILLAEVM